MNGFCMRANDDAINVNHFDSLLEVTFVAARLSAPFRSHLRALPSRSFPLGNACCRPISAYASSQLSQTIFHDYHRHNDKLFSIFVCLFCVRRVAWLLANRVFVVHAFTFWLLGLWCFARRPYFGGGCGCAPPPLPLDVNVLFYCPFCSADNACALRYRKALSQSQCCCHAELICHFAHTHRAHDAHSSLTGTKRINQ